MIVDLRNVPPPSPDVGVGELVARSAERTPDKLALKLRETGETSTYAELDRRSTQLANGLLGIGLARGDRIATWVEDCAEYVELYLAAAKAGLLVAPINGRFVAAEARHILEDSGAAALVWTPGMVGQVAALGEGAAPAITIGIGGAAAGHALEDLIEAGSEELPPAPDPGETFILGYTSGTTGTPKAAMLSHRAVVAAGRANYVSYRLSADTVFGLTGSMSFVAVVPAHVICALGLGATLVMMGKYDVPTLIETIEREGVTFTYCASPLLAEFAAAVKAAPERVRTLHSVMHSASKADPAVLKAVYEAVGDRLIEGWGMTENSGSLATATVPADYLDADSDETVFATVGRPAVGCAVRVADEDGNELPHDGETIGNLAFRSPGQASGYWNRPEATAEAMVDGWIFTGDLGSIDSRGYVYVTERRTDLIVSGGMNVYPSEVEQCIKALDGVVDAGVVGVPHERWGQAVVAAVVVADGGPDEATIIAHCRENLASYKKPNEVVFMTELPYTATLKLARAALREELAQGRV
ncbi:MAG: AMP-binding protein [Actinobacteria bacterium]|nr:AMP-binding protein [Actinomycetota bacterium]